MRQNNNSVALSRASRAPTGDLRPGGRSPRWDCRQHAAVPGRHWPHAEVSGLGIAQQRTVAKLGRPTPRLRTGCGQCIAQIGTTHHIHDAKLSSSITVATVRGEPVGPATPRHHCRDHHRQPVAPTGEPLLPAPGVPDLPAGPCNRLTAGCRRDSDGRTAGRNGASTTTGSDRSHAARSTAGPSQCRPSQSRSL